MPLSAEASENLYLMIGHSPFLEAEECDTFTDVDASNSANEERGE